MAKAFSIRIIRLFTSKSERSELAKKNIIISFFLRIIQILIGLAIVPLTLEYLNDIKYGIWLALLSIVNWFSLFDVGLGNGLRNKLTVALANREQQVARHLISTAYFSLFVISLFSFFIFILLNNFLNWQRILNTELVPNEELNALVLWVLGCFFLRLVLQLINNILYAIQRPAVRDLIETLGKVLNLIIVFILIHISNNSLLYLGISLSLTSVLVLLFSSIVIFSKYLKEYAPRLIDFRIKYFNALFGIGGKFFLIHISGIVLYTSDNVIITQLFSPREVAQYQIAHSYFGILLTAFTMIVTPFWSAFTDAYTKKEIKWIKSTVHQLVIIWVLSVFIILLMLIFSNSIYHIWLGDKISIPLNISIYWALFVAIQTLNSIFVHFINGIGKIKLQLYLSIAAAFINIPLSIFFAKIINLGPGGVLLATITTQLVMLAIFSIQFFKILRGKSNGIWNA